MKKKNETIETIKRVVRTISGYIRDDIESGINSLAYTYSEMSSKSDSIERALKKTMPRHEYASYRLMNKTFNLWSTISIISFIYSLFISRTLREFLPIVSAVSLAISPIIWTVLYGKRIDSCIREYREKYEWEDDFDET